MKHIKELKLNEDKHMVDPYFEGARTKIKELAEYFEMDEKLFVEMIWNGYTDLVPNGDKYEKVGSMVYTYGLI